MNDSILKNECQLFLSWKNLSLFDRKTGNYVLNNLSGQAKNGDFLIIMGPSGAGKSSFLSIITAKLSSYSSNFKVKGKTALNGRNYSEQEFISIASYVPQDDLLMQTLTVEQTLTFQAQLKLSNLSKNQRFQRIQQILKLLNLYQIRHSFIGGQQKKSISGGQKKRVAIGVELISNPKVLILDEPTSGLDSVNSMKIINILSNLAQKDNKLVIATIHQPSSLMFQNFDKLMILKGGKQIYYNQARMVVDYMESLNIKIDQRMNPADFFMLQISSFKQSQGHLTKMNAQNWMMNIKNSSKGLKSYDQLKQIDFKKNPPTPLLQQFQPLLIRSLKSFIRNPSNQFGRLMQMICYPIFIGTLYYDVLQNVPDKTNLLDLQEFLIKFACFIYLGIFFTIGQTLYDTMLVFPTQKQLVLKQVHSNMYSLNLYFVTKLLIEIPGMLIPIWIATTIVFLVVGLERTFQNWILYQFVFTLTAFCGYLLGIVVGIFCKQQQFAAQAAPFVVIPLVVYGGLIVNLKRMPNYSSWIQYLTPLRYGYNILTNSQLHTNQLNDLGQIEFAKDKLGLVGSNTDNLIMLMLLCYGLFVLSFVILYVRRKLN